MKLQPTCSICLSKIKLIRHDRRKLLCKHIFHASCIDSIFKPQCPLCEHPIFNNDEETLLSCTSEEAAIDILKNLHQRNINVKNIFTFLTSHPDALRYKWIVNLMYKYCDFTELLADNLNDKAFVKEIVSRGRVNWFKTFFGGLTFSDLVYERTNDPEIISLVHTMLPIDPCNKMNTVHLSTSSFTPLARQPHQRHRRMDSMSGAALEQLLGCSQPKPKPKPANTATVRRSFRSRSLYPALNEREVQTYPIYERLYPVVPSAPPLDLM